MNETTTVRKRDSEKGTALILGLFMTLVLFGSTGAVLMVSARNARAVGHDAEYKTALFLAEGGIAAAMEEIGSGLDRDGNGVGNISVETPIGTYQVTSIALGNEAYRLESRGLSQGDLAVDVQEVVDRSPVTKFPSAAVSVLGEVDKLKLNIKKHANLLIDGGDKPAFAIANDVTYSEMLEDFAKAQKDGRLNSGQIRGNQGRGNWRDEENSQKWSQWAEDAGDEPVVIPFGKVEAPSPDMVNLDPLYEDFINGTHQKLLTAEVHGEKLGSGTDIFEFGTPDNPATVHFSEKVEMKGDDVIRGHGTLVISKEFRLKENSRLDWDGDVIVLAQPSKKALLEIDGRINVAGNLMVLGEGFEDTEVKIRHNAEVFVDGSMFVGTLNREDKGKKAKIEVDGKVHINGMMSILGGKKVEVKFKDDSDFRLEGMFQMSLGDFVKNDELKLEFQGKVEILKSDEAMRRAARDLAHLSDALDTDIEVVVSYQVVKRGWSKTTAYSSSSEQQGDNSAQQPQ